MARLIVACFASLTTAFPSIWTSIVVPGRPWTMYTRDVFAAVAVGPPTIAAASPAATSTTPPDTMRRRVVTPLCDFISPPL
jgi:hypothetical protein